MSASRMPTRRPSLENAAARLTVSDDFPTPPFSGGDRDHAGGRLELDRLVALRPPATQFAAERGPFLRAHHVEGKLHRRDSGDRADLAADLFLEGMSERASDDRQRDRDGDLTAADGQVAHHVELGDGLAQLGIDHPRERGEDHVA